MIPPYEIMSDDGLELIENNADIILEEVGIDYDIRGMEKPSDHAPIWTKFNL